jgi:uncharacterized protein YhfF
MKLDEPKRKYPGSTTFKFGDGPELCAELLAHVRSGKKVATCAALREFEEGGEAMPVVGRRDIALNWDGTPALVIETESVTITPYCDVDEAFALAEGENDSLAGWREDHRSYFERNGGFDPEMKLVCESFRSDGAQGAADGECAASLDDDVRTEDVVLRCLERPGVSRWIAPTCPQPSLQLTTSL